MSDETTMAVIGPQVTFKEVRTLGGRLINVIAGTPSSKPAIFGHGATEAEAFADLLKNNPGHFAVIKNLAIPEEPK